MQLPQNYRLDLVVSTIKNETLECSRFPDNAKNAMATPLHQKNSNLDRENYRPVSILPVISKIYERANNQQLSSFFSQHFNVYLSAFRPGYGCQSALLRIIEDRKQTLLHFFFQSSTTTESFMYSQ